MNIHKIAPDLYEIKNLVGSEKLNEMLLFIESLKEEDWLVDGMEEFWYGNQTNSAKHISDEIYNSIMSLFDSDISGSSVAIQRYKRDKHIKEHRDYWLYDLDHHIRFGLLFYFNDNYEGGELYYPELNIKIKPDPGSLFIHGGNILHQSLPVSSDSVRYFATAFLRGTKDIPVVLNQELFKGIEENDGTEYK